MRKKDVLFMIFLLGILGAHAQRADTLPADSKPLYLKYLKQRSTYQTLGWVLLGTGAALFGTAYLINVENGWNGPTKGEGLFSAGIIAAAASPPFFILAAIKKRKTQLVLKEERLTSAIPFDRPYYPAISLRIKLK